MQKKTILLVKHPNHPMQILIKMYHLLPAYQQRLILMQSYTKLHLLLKIIS